MAAAIVVLPLIVTGECRVWWLGRSGAGGDRRVLVTSRGSSRCGRRRAKRSKVCCSPFRLPWAPVCWGTMSGCAVGAVRVGESGGTRASMLAIDRHAWTNRWHDRHPLEKLVPAGGMLLVALIPAAVADGAACDRRDAGVDGRGCQGAAEGGAGDAGGAARFPDDGCAGAGAGGRCVRWAACGLGAGWAAVGGGGYVAVAGGDFVSGFPDPDHAGCRTCADAWGGLACRGRCGSLSC